MNKIIISIVTINYNNCTGLRRTIDSLQTQTSKSFEWIVVDGGSTDGSLPLGKDIVQCKSCKIISEPDDGIFEAMNKGIQNAKGDVVMFLNSGDTLFSENSLREIILLIEARCNFQVYLFGFYYGDAKRFPRPLWWRFWSLPTSHQAIVYRNDFLKKNRFNSDLKFSADFEHFLRVVKNGAKVYRHDEVIITNEPYGSNENFPCVQIEYQKIYQMYMPKVLAITLSKIKFKYLSFRNGR